MELIRISRDAKGHALCLCRYAAPASVPPPRGEGVRGWGKRLRDPKAVPWVSADALLGA
ncbi:MAG: hypothetical protein IJN11_03405 [Oscillospiraceae bacterium]|nr:hypothetical protein [Oscillospiraceae bacterium]